LAKGELNLRDLEGLVLSPGDIFWIKNSGAEILIAKKSDFLNFALVEKIANSSHQLRMENQIDLSIQHEFMKMVNAHRREVFFKEKLQWKKRIFDLLLQNNLSQFEIGQLAWMAWSSIDRDSVKALIDFDIDLFKRSLNVASSYVFCALLLGYYQDDFLKALFTNTLKELMSIERNELLNSIKMEMEQMRENDTLTSDDNNFIKRIYPRSISWAGERYNGSGVNAYNKKEMSDLEVLLIALERQFSYRDVDGESIFDSIQKGKFHCDEKILSVIKKGLIQTEAALGA
jgi:hypothetical protein